MAVRVIPPLLLASAVAAGPACAERPRAEDSVNAAGFSAVPAPDTWDGIPLATLGFAPGAPASTGVDADWQVTAAVVPFARPVDPQRFISYAAGLSYSASPSWQLSAAYGESVQAPFSTSRASGAAMSAMFRQPFGSLAFSATASWGLATRGGEVTERFLLEGSLTRYSRHQFFARAANVTHSIESAAAEARTRMHPTTAGTLGYVYATRHGPQQFGVGFSITAFKVPPDLEVMYGDLPLAYQLYVRVWPWSGR